MSRRKFYRIVTRDGDEIEVTNAYRYAMLLQAGWEPLEDGPIEDPNEPDEDSDEEPDEDSDEEPDEDSDEE